MSHKADFYETFLDKEEKQQKGGGHGSKGTVKSLSFRQMREEDQLARFSDADLASIINPASFFTSKNVAKEGDRFDEESEDTFYFDTKINGLRFVGVPQSIRRYREGVENECFFSIF